VPPQLRNNLPLLKNNLPALSGSPCTCCGTVYHSCAECITDKPSMNMVVSGFQNTIVAPPSTVSPWFCGRKMFLASLNGGYSCPKVGPGLYKSILGIENSCQNPGMLISETLPSTGGAYRTYLQQATITVNCSGRTLTMSGSLIMQDFYYPSTNGALGCGAPLQPCLFGVSPRWGFGGFCQADYGTLCNGTNSCCSATPLTVPCSTTDPNFPDICTQDVAFCFAY